MLYAVLSIDYGLEYSVRTESAGFLVAFPPGTPGNPAGSDVVDLVARALASMLLVVIMVMIVIVILAVPFLRVMLVGMPNRRNRIWLEILQQGMRIPNPRHVGGPRTNI